jgi:spore photoproduct lyase
MAGVKYQEYVLLNGEKKRLVQQVKDGTIITRFDRTPTPKQPEDVVCPHFLELKWGYGCPFDCSWCFLKGTFRMLETKTKPIAKSYEKVVEHVNYYFQNDGVSTELLNAGELADSLMTEHTENPFSRLIIPLFEKHKKHKLLLLTKSTNIKNLLDIKEHEQTIVGFSLNAPSVSKRWEKAPAPLKRIAAGKKLAEHGYPVRVRIDPMVPIANWRKDYGFLIDKLFESFVPERITIGSLRGLASTIRNCKDTSWVKYLNESSNWGKKISLEKRLELYTFVKDYLKENFGYKKFALCKETVETWSGLGLDYKNMKCNCLL